MTCTKCGGRDLKVTRSRQADAPTYYDNAGRPKSRIPKAMRRLVGDKGTWRRYRCQCGHDTNTIELPVTVQGER